MEAGMAEPIVKLVGLSKYFPLQQHWVANFLGRPRRILKAVDRVDLTIPEGQTFGLVGESGCGKSTLGRVLCTLLDPTDGQIYFRGQNLRELTRKELRKFKKEIQIVFQDPYSSLDPRMPISRILERPLIAHGVGGNVRGRREKVFEMMRLVGLDQDQAGRYPHEFSGGQRQRIAIARALVLRPKFIVADEPVSALDVSIQAQILNLFLKLQEDLNLTYLFISHDLTVVRHVSNWTGIMYLGQIVEWGKSKEIFQSPVHPYTLFLLASAPRVPAEPIPPSIRLRGEVSMRVDNPKGCRLLPRCPRATARCAEAEPSLREIGEVHWVACWNI
jgi:oligopeptide transport system ATP-binding protein